MLVGVINKDAEIALVPKNDKKGFTEFKHTN